MADSTASQCPTWCVRPPEPDAHPEDVVIHYNEPTLTHIEGRDAVEVGHELAFRQSDCEVSIGLTQRDGDPAPSVIVEGLVGRVLLLAPAGADPLQSALSELLAVARA